MTEIFAVPPSPLGATAHLYMPGYQPGKKRRPAADRAPMCGSSYSVNPNQVTLLAAALQDWPNPDGGADLRGPFAWSWCKPCIGHVVTVYGMQLEVMTAVANKAGGDA